MKNSITVSLAMAMIHGSTLAVEKAKVSKPYESGFELPGSQAEIYKTVGETKLKIYVHKPKGLKPGAQRPAIVFFFGGAWRNGTPKQFHPHCRYLATQGMVAMTADYRVSSRQGTKPHHCVRDGKSAIRWVRRNAGQLGVDPKRIAAGGGSAGGHVAACTGVLPGIEEEGEDLLVSSVPNSMVLFNPALVLAPVKGVKGFGNVSRLKERFGMPPESFPRITTSARICRPH